MHLGGRDFKILTLHMKERFLAKVNKTDTCWLWTASVRGSSGYGAFRIGRKIYSAHRVSYKLFKGEIPIGLLVCHACDNRMCVNPEHLFLGTYSDNMKDCSKKGRINRYHSPEAILKQALKLRKWNEELLHCSVCKKMKPRSEFHKNKHRSSGHMSECKKCRYK